jgi:hypothetical protein
MLQQHHLIMLTLLGNKVPVPNTYTETLHVQSSIALNDKIFKLSDTFYNEKS